MITPESVHNIFFVCRIFLSFLLRSTRPRVGGALRRRVFVHDSVLPTLVGAAWWSRSTSRLYHFGVVKAISLCSHKRHRRKPSLTHRPSATTRQNLQTRRRRNIDIYFPPHAYHCLARRTVLGREAIKRKAKRSQRPGSRTM